MNSNDVMVTLKAIELMSYGLDISKFDKEQIKNTFINAKTKTTVSRITPNVQNYIWHLDNYTKELFSVYSDYFVRADRVFHLVDKDFDDKGLIGDNPINTEVTKEIVNKTVQMLYANKVCDYEGVDEDILDPSRLEKMIEEDNKIDRKAVPTAPIIKDLAKDKTKTNYGIFTAIAYYRVPKIRDKMLDAYDKVYTSFNLKHLSDFPVIDNRLYIPITDYDRYRIKKYMKAQGYSYSNDFDDMKYIVISKNMYDYYYSSYGSTFQSCYSLTSDYFGWYGMYPMGVFDSHYIIYGTKEKGQKTTILGNNAKWASPYMFFRCWGWTDTDNNLLLDWAYTKDCEQWRQFFTATKHEVLSKYMRIDVTTTTDTLEGAEMSEYYNNEVRLKFYPDSVYTTDSFKFRLHSADRCDRFGGELPRYQDRFDSEYKNLYDSALQYVKAVSESFNPYKDLAVVDGTLMNPKKCPITGLLIDEASEKSPYAKYLNAPVSNMAVITAIDGFYKCDAMTQECNVPLYRFRDAFDDSYVCNTEFTLYKAFTSGPSTTLKTFKELLKGHIKDTPYDVILLRVVDGDKVNYIKYKKTGVKA